MSPELSMWYLPLLAILQRWMSSPNRPKQSATERNKLGLLKKNSSALLRYKPRRSTYFHIRLAVRLFACLASKHF